MSDSERKVRWQRCGAPACKCGLIHDLDADDVVATVHRVTESGEWSEVGFLRHVALIEAAPKMHDALRIILDVFAHHDGRRLPIGASNQIYAAARAALLAAEPAQSERKTGPQENP
jgi:hypothetical protein